QKRITEMEQQAASESGLVALHRKREQLQDQASRLAQAIAVAGHSPTLLSHLASAETQLSSVTQQIAAYKPVNLSAPIEEVRNFVMRNILELRTLLRQDAQRARAALMKHLKELILMPKDTPTGPVFEVSGGVEMANDVMPVVARDGIEPPTPAFSGLL